MNGLSIFARLLLRARQNKSVSFRLHEFLLRERRVFLTAGTRVFIAAVILVVMQSN